jgi:hypothetical protein
MAAGTYNFVDENRIEQGVDSTRQFIWKDSDGNPVNLTGYTARMQLRKSVSDANVLLELSTSNSGISITGSTGTISLYFKKADTTGVTWVEGVYDLELTSPGGLTTRLIEGTFVLSKEVTRA